MVWLARARCPDLFCNGADAGVDDLELCPGAHGFDHRWQRNLANGHGACQCVAQGGSAACRRDDARDVESAGFEPALFHCNCVGRSVELCSPVRDGDFLRAAEGRTNEHRECDDEPQQRANIHMPFAVTGSLHETPPPLARDGYKVKLFIMVTLSSKLGLVVKASTSNVNSARSSQAMAFGARRSALFTCANKAVLSYALKCSRSPGISHLVATRCPVSDSVTKAVRMSAPPKQMLVT